jgi:Zn-dependent alcohol dehydrogenase
MTTYPISTTAIVCDAPKGDQIQWRKEKVQLREPLEDEVLVRIIASGICHTDITMSALPPGIPGFAPYPKVFGHEGAGIVERVGSAVTHVVTGDMVLLSFDYCEKDDCRGCADSTPGHCTEFAQRNFIFAPDVYKGDKGNSISGLFFGQSSFSKLAVVKGTSALNVSSLVKDEEELKLFSPMGCGYQTGAGAVTELAKTRDGDSVTACPSRDYIWSWLTWTCRYSDLVVSEWLPSWCVQSLFGNSACWPDIKAAKIRGATIIIGVDKVKSRLDLAVIDTSDFASLAADLTRAIQDIVPKGTIATFDTTGVIPIINAGVQSLGTKGQMILIGIVNGEMSVDMGKMLRVGFCNRIAQDSANSFSLALRFEDVPKAMRIRPRYANRVQWDCTI